MHSTSMHLNWSNIKSPSLTRDLKVELDTTLSMKHATLSYASKV